MKNTIHILVIAYYWPPSGGAGVQRWLNLSSLLIDRGYEITVFTPDLSEYPQHDDTLVQSIHSDISQWKTPIFEPYNIARLVRLTTAKKYSGFSDSQKVSWKTKLSQWIRGNLFIPDARKFWIKPSINFLSKKLAESPIDLVISTGPPHSMHLIARGLKLKFPHMKWIADFRDPWTNVEYYHQLRLSKWADQKYRKLEKSVLQKADKVVTVSNAWASEFDELGANQTAVIRNGYAKRISSDKSDKKSGIGICYLGLLGDNRNHPKLWETIQTILSQNIDHKFTIAGNLSSKVATEIENNAFNHQIKVLGFIDKDRVEQLLISNDIFILSINDGSNASGRIPLKLYEYLSTEKAIVCFGPSHAQDVKKLINDYPKGLFIDINDPNKLDINTWYPQIKSIDIDQNYIEKFSFRHSADQYDTLIKKITS